MVHINDFTKPSLQGKTWGVFHDLLRSMLFTLWIFIFIFTFFLGLSHCLTNKKLEISVCVRLMWVWCQWVPCLPFFCEQKCFSKKLAFRCSDSATENRIFSRDSCLKCFILPVITQALSLLVLLFCLCQSTHFSSLGKKKNLTSFFLSVSFKEWSNSIWTIMNVA